MKMFDYDATGPLSEKERDLLQEFGDYLAGLAQSLKLATSAEDLKGLMSGMEDKMDELEQKYPELKSPE